MIRYHQKTADVSNNLFSAVFSAYRGVIVLIVPDESAQRNRPRVHFGDAKARCQGEVPWHTLLLNGYPHRLAPTLRLDDFLFQAVKPDA